MHRVTKLVYTGDTICSSSPGWRSERVTKWVYTLETCFTYTCVTVPNLVILGKTCSVTLWIFQSRLKTTLFDYWSNLPPVPLKLRPYSATEIRLLPSSLLYQEAAHADAHVHKNYLHVHNRSQIRRHWMKWFWQHFSHSNCQPLRCKKLRLNKINIKQHALNTFQSTSISTFNRLNDIQQYWYLVVVEVWQWWWLYIRRLVN